MGKDDFYNNTRQNFPAYANSNFRNIKTNDNMRNADNSTKKFELQDINISSQNKNINSYNNQGRREISNTNISNEKTNITNNMMRDTSTTNSKNNTISTNNTNNQCNTIMSSQNSILENSMYTQGYLREQIGKLVRVQFLIGTNSLQDRTGILTQVGASYIVLRSFETGTDIFCDIYSIKFVTIANQQVGVYGGMPL